MTLTELIGKGLKGWHGVKLNQADWGDHSHSIALSAESSKEKLLAHFVFNAYWETLNFELPRLQSGNSWRRWIDTFLATPEDIVPWNEAPSVAGPTYQAGPRSVVVLWAKSESGASYAA